VLRLIESLTGKKNYKVHSIYNPSSAQFQRLPVAFFASTSAALAGGNGEIGKYWTGDNAPSASALRLA